MEKIDDLKEELRELESGRWLHVIIKGDGNDVTQSDFQRPVPLSDGLDDYLMSCAQDYIANEIIRVKREIGKL